MSRFNLLLFIACTINVAEEGPLPLSLLISSSKELCFSLASLCFTGKTDVSPGGARISTERIELQGCAPQHTWPKPSPGHLWHKLAKVAPPWEWWYIAAQAANKPHLLVCTAPFSHMVTFVTSSITQYNENTGICFAATLVFHECLDIYVPPRDIMSCQDFMLMALSILIKAVPTCFSCVAK